MLSVSIKTSNFSCFSQKNSSLKNKKNFIFSLDRLQV
jgi:hypothetical protein